MYRPLVAVFSAWLIASCASHAPQGGTAATAGLASEPRPTPEKEPQPTLKLPGHTRPLRYLLALQVDPAAARFSGEVIIDISVSGPRATLWLHGLNLNVQHARVQRADGSWLEARYEQINEDGLAALHLPEPVEGETLRIEIRYDATFGTKLRGIYKVVQGEDAYAFSQFEALSAREAFPCFDEPRFKTPFEVRLKTPSGQVAVANTEESGSSPDAAGQWVEHVFAKTQPLPTYLLAIAVGPLDVVDAPPLPPSEIRAHAVPFRGVAVRGRGPELAYALAHTPPMVEVLEQYFGVAYPYDKLDLIAVPDFAAGAMENAGAITFREAFLLMADEALQVQLRNFAEVTAHELAHQWFGNLVTMPFWDDIWLNEAFATWMATRVVEKLYPDYHPELDQLLYTHMAMHTDEKRSARSIRQPIESSQDIENAFDGITYSKGGAVLGMFEGYIGEEAFREGLRLYMQRFAFGTATAEDLVAALSEAAGQPLKEPFFSFLTQPGVPVVDATLACEAGKARVTLKQSRFTPLGDAPDPEAAWQIPVCLRYAAGQAVTTQCTLLREPQAEVALEGEGCPSWWMPNAGAQGYYRWALPSPSLSTLSTRGWPHLSPAEKQSTVENMAASLRAGRGAPETVYPALLRLMKDGDRHVLATGLAPLSFAHDYLLSDEGQQAYSARLREVLKPRAQQLGWVGKAQEPGETALMRRTLVSALCLEAVDPQCRSVYAKAGRVALGLSDGSAKDVGNDLMGIALVVAVQDGGEEAFDAALARLSASQDAIERSRLLRAVGLTRDPRLTARVRELSLDSRLRVNEVMSPLWSQASIGELRQETWDWVLAHLEALQARLPGHRGTQLASLASGFCSAQDAAAVRRVFDQHTEAFGGAQRVLDNVVEGIEQCAARAAVLKPGAEAFFGAHEGRLSKR